MSVDGNFHLRLDIRNLLDRLLLLVKSKKNLLVKTLELTYDSNFKKTKNKFSSDSHIQQFAMLLFILGERNCYEFLRMNSPNALPHITNIESLIRS